VQHSMLLNVHPVLVVPQYLRTSPADCLHHRCHPHACAAAATCASACMRVHSGVRAHPGTRSRTSACMRPLWHTRNSVQPCVWTRMAAASAWPLHWPRETGRVAVCSVAVCSAAVRRRMAAFARAAWLSSPREEQPQPGAAANMTSTPPKAHDSLLWRAAGERLQSLLQG
jgi:hypothetical protein